MTPDWEKLGLREPRKVVAFGLVVYDWNVPSECNKVRMRRLQPKTHGGFSVMTSRRHVVDHDTIESAAKHLKRLGCGL